MRPGLETTAAVSPAPLDGRAAVRAFVRERRFDDAWALLAPLLRAGDEAWAWAAARNVLKAAAAEGWSPPVRRQARLGLLCTYTVEELAEQLRIACAAFGVGAELYVAPYGQLEQEVLV